MYRSELPDRTFLEPCGVPSLLDGSSQTVFSRHRTGLVDILKIPLIRLGLSLPLLFLLLSALAGCGTLIHGTSQNVACISSPAGALVRTVDGTTCKTPCAVKVKRTKDNFLTIEKEGYEPVVLAVHSFLLKSSAGEILLPRELVCSSIDFASGAAYHLDPEQVDVNLKPSTSGNGPDKGP